MRERWQRWFGMGIVLLGLLGQGAHPLPVHAQTTNSDDEIVYLDTAGFIRVLDPQLTSGQSAVQWVSPVGGWRDFALGDFNNDGDAEIVAVGGANGIGKLAIYDPVIAEGRINADQVINSVPWATLYETDLLGTPLLVSAGDLVPTVAGNEIAYVFALNPADRLDPDDQSRLAVLQMAAGISDGSDWEEVVRFVDFGNDWDRLSLGDLDNVAGEEVILVDRSGLVRVYRITAGALQKFFENESGARPWQDGIAAYWSSTELRELLMARSSSPGGATFWAFYYSPTPETNFRDGYTELLLPTPRTLFAGDINGNGDDELFFLRSVPSNITNRMRLFMRNAGGDTLPVFEQLLDTDNGYQGGATGDTDGDGRAEVVIIRNNNIRVYTAPESNATALIDNSLTNQSNGTTVHLANLDRNGIVVTPKLALSNPQLNPSLSAGADPSTLTVALNNNTTGTATAIPFTAAVVGRPTWLTVSPSSGATPATLSLTLDPGRLAAGTYTATITIDSSNDQVLDVPLALTVVATVRAGLMMTPDRPPTVISSCAADSASHQQTIRLTGPAGITFAARIPATGSATAAELLPATGVEWPSDVPWLRASSPNVLPTTMLLTFSPATVTTQRSTATVILSYADEQGTQSRTLAVTLFCATDQLFLPLIAR